MGNHERCDFLVQKCFMAMDNMGTDFSSHIHLNLLLSDSIDDKLQFISSAVNEKKKKLGQLAGDIAMCMYCILEQYDGFQHYKSNFEMYYHLFETELKEYIFVEEVEKKLSLDSVPDTFSADEIGKSSAFKYLFPWINAASDLEGYFTAVHYQKTLQEGNEISIPDNSKKTSAHLRFNGGRVLNLKERYYLIDEFLGVDRKIQILNISRESKEKLLSLILHCNPKNAQQLINGTYDGKLRKKEISDYIKQIEKE